jgi:hypothetical protein
MTNFERASWRMKAQGFTPFTPDHADGRAPRWLRGNKVCPELSDVADRADAIIASFAIGMLLGGIVIGMLMP